MHGLVALAGARFSLAPTFASPMQGERPPRPDDVTAARARMARLPAIRRTPTFRFTEWRGLAVKFENLQHLGSFKTRGVGNRFLAAPPGGEGVATASAGNHGLAVADAARQSGLPCRVHVPPTAVARKVDAIRALGAEVVPTSLDDLRTMLLDGASFDHGGRTFIHPWTDPAVAAGHGTAASELLEDAPGITTLVIPLGGGGLASGVLAAVADHGAPGVRVIGVQAAGAAAWAETVRTGTPAQVGKPATIADGIAVPWAHPILHEALVKGLDRVVTVTEDEIRSAMAEALRVTRTILEPSAAAGLAWCLKQDGRDRRDARDGRGPAACILTGGNADPALVKELL